MDPTLCLDSDSCLINICITDVRGLGLMIGVEFDQPTRPIVDKWAELGVLSNAAGGNALELYLP